MPPTSPIDGQGLHVVERGRGTPLVLVHGWAMCSGAFAPQLEGLAPAHRVIAVDLRGHGASPAGPGSSPRLEDHAADLAALLERRDLRGAVLVGWSLGGQVALRAAPRLRARLAGLVLLATTPRFTLADGWPHGLPAPAVEALALRVARRPRATLERFFDGMFTPGELSPARRAALRERALGAPGVTAETALAGLALLRETDLRGALSALELPALVVHGREDAICPAGAGVALAAALPRAELRLLPGSGHAPHLARPAEVNDLLARFAAAISDTERAA